MARSLSTQPTEVDLQILRILWTRGGEAGRTLEAHASGGLRA
ncbi:MAG: hypothetical protein NTZ32_11585 [Planctomycetales bacterium]|nr:hypothetical protein [Planctomycetales bacterium]